MPALHDLQTSFAQAVIADMTPPLPGLVEDRPGARARLQIYRNHYLVTLVDALQATFPVVCQIAGEAAFRSLARAFVMTAPPASPCLFEYGGGLPEVLERHFPDFPYLGDLARLEWAINVAFHALDAPAAVPSSSAGRSRHHVRAHPSCRLVASPYPIDRIWAACSEAHGRPERACLDAGAVHLLVYRSGVDVGWMRLPPVAFVFVGVLIIDGSLRKACALAHALDPAFMPAELLAAMVESGAVSVLSE
jgi:Putative DNA-binding domain